MLKKASKTKVLLITIIIVSSLLTISASGSFFYRNAVMGYETQKNMLLNLNFSYTYLLNSLQEHSKEYIVNNDAESKDTFQVLVEDYTTNKTIRLNFKAVSELQSFNWLSSNFSEENYNMNSLVGQLDFTLQEEQTYLLFLKSFDEIIRHLDSSVQSMDSDAFIDPGYTGHYNLFNYYMVELTSSYLNRINQHEDQALNLQNFFGFLSLFLSLSLAAVGAFVAYSTVITNRNNSYFRQLFSTTVETADFGLAILDMNYEYKYMNAQYRDILHIPEQEPRGKTPYQLLPKEFTDNIPKPTSFEDGLINSTITLHTWGVPKHVNVSRFPIKDENGQINFVSIIRDFTDLVNLELQLKEQLAQIEFHSKAKDTFMANISHEMKTPLNAIIGLTYVLNEMELTQKQQNIVNRITSSSNLLLNLINDVLDLSKIKNSDFRLYPSNVLLTNVLSELEGIATALIGDKNVLWRTEYDYPASLCVKIDKIRLTQVLLNLINNACKFTSEGFIQLKVDTLEENEEKILLRFSITDTGLGMEEQDLHKLFQEFEQLENYLTKQHQGTGLGLIISKNIIETMGGQIWVSSEKDKGSTFTFTVPAEKASSAHFVDSQLTESDPIIDGKGQRVLVVEDNEINYEVTENLLRKANIICENAEDGKIALEMCKKVPDGYYRLILMDIHMPNMDGYTTSRILKNEMNIKTPIVALTATNVESQATEEYKDIIEDYIPKPFNYNELFSKLSPYFEKREAPSISTQRNPNTSMEDPFSDRVKAIENLGGMADLYEKHLKKFKSSYYRIDEEIQDSLERGDWEEARRLAHSVKGLSGTLGLPHLQKISALLEEALLKDDPNAEDLLNQFSKKLKDVCNAE